MLRRQFLNHLSVALNPFGRFKAAPIVARPYVERSPEVQVLDSDVLRQPEKQDLIARIGIADHQYNRLLALGLQGGFGIADQNRSARSLMNSGRVWRSMSSPSVARFR